MEEVTQEANVNVQKSLRQEMMIPFSIVLAGALIGAGLYFGGSQNAPVQPANIQVANNEQQAGDLTAKVNPVSDDDYIKGSRDADITIVEYSDFDCPFCSRFHTTMNNIVAKYDGEVAWVYRQRPIEQLHPNAVAVSLASECVGALGGNEAFWNFTDGYLDARGAGVRTPHGQLIPELVQATGVDVDAFTSCFENQEYIADIEADSKNALETGGTGTPWSILIGPSGKTYPINGAIPQQSIEQLIEIAKKEA